VGEYGFWLAMLTWLGDRAPPLVAGFVGGVLGQLAFSAARARWRKAHD
jgi:hypothetical protein